MPSLLLHPGVPASPISLGCSGASVQPCALLGHFLKALDLLWSDRFSSRLRLVTLLGPAAQLQMSFVSFEGRQMRSFGFLRRRCLTAIGLQVFSIQPSSPTQSFLINKVKEPELEMVLCQLEFFCHFKDAVVAPVPQPLCLSAMAVPCQVGQSRT